MFDRLERVMVLTNEGRGGNDFVETKSIPKFEGIKLDYAKNKKYIDECDLEKLFVGC